MKLNKSKKSYWSIVIILLLLVIVVLVGIIIYNQIQSKEPETESKGVVGVISDEWDTGIEEEEPPESAGIQIPGYSTAQMTEGDRSLHLSIGNPANNQCGFYATLMLADGTVLYKSELLKPGSGLTDIPLSKTLDKGEYEAIVYYECVTLDEANAPLNAAESEFKLIVR